MVRNPETLFFPQEFVLSWGEARGGGRIFGVVGSLGAFCIDSLIF